MALKSRLELRQQQRLALTPEQRTRLTVLRLSPFELEEELAREAARNPFLRFERASSPATAPAAADPVAMAPERGFQESLRQQVAAMGLDTAEAALVDFLIGELRDDGYLDVSLDILGDELGLPPDPLEGALAILQRCDPAGIGARSLAECLTLQLVDRGHPRSEAVRMTAQLAALARRDWSSAAEALGTDEEGARHVAALFRRLSPRPVLESGQSATEYLRPDLRYERASDGTIAIRADRAGRPSVTLDAALIRRAETEGFAPDLLQRARAWMDAIEQRGRTLDRIGAWLVQHQAGFFAQGLPGLKPASRSALAAEIGLHPSTVSRAVAGKAIDVDGRLWPLSVFFSSALGGVRGPVSSRAVQQRLAQLVAAEPALRPLSDNKLAHLLRAEGVDIARRTVAKYRQGLRIPPTSVRRRQAADQRGE